MDSSADVVEKERFQRFKMGKKPGHAHTRSHSRNDSISSLKSLTTGDDFSHFSLPLTNYNGVTKPPRPISLPPLVPPGSANNQNSGVLPTASTAVANSVPSGKRNSHHRRRSSVSTRHESAELMGMSVPSLPPAAPEDNINLGEKDSIRRRALWALEGKPDVAFNKVEIPDFSTTDMEKIMSSKSSLTPSNPPSYGNGLNMNNKRDSFKLLAGSSSSKDQLQTLVEEEEEDEEEDLQCLLANAEDSLPSPAPSIKENIPHPTSFTSVPVAQQQFPKPRPATLNLRPLSLTPENLMTAPPLRPGLRALSLTPSSGGAGDSTTPDSLKQLRRSPQVVTPTPASRRPVLNLVLGQVTDGLVDGEEGKVSDRRSSISYKRSSNGIILNPTGLATPEMTPTFGRRFSTSGSTLSISSSAGMSEEDVVFTPPTQPQSRPLSTSEQHFLFKSHHALLARITDLEKALSVRMRDSAGIFSRRPSISSTVSGMSDSENLSVTGSTEGPSDEMLCLIADLKAERDELKRDVDGWRQRVNNLESQTAVLVKRVESERREAWVARSKAGLLEVEKGVLAKKLEAMDELIKSHEKEKELLEKDKVTLEKEMQGFKEWVDELENELKVVKKELDCEKARAFYDPLATPTPNKSFENAFVRPVVIISPPEPTGKPKNYGLGFMSGDSESSTDVELDSFDDPASGFGLRAVEEELDEAYNEENELAGYEDEDDGDDLSHFSSSSFDSDELDHSIQRRVVVGLPHSPTTPTFGVYKTLPPAPMPYMLPAHFYQSSLSMNWTFPKGPGAAASVVKENEEGVDRFFDCLDDTDSEASDSIPSNFSYEKSKGLFASGFALAPEDDDAAFFLPSGVGVPVPEPVKQRTQLEVVTEEEEEDEDEKEKEQSDFEDDGAMFGDIGGIKITFTPPQEEEEKEEREHIPVSLPKPKRISPPPTLPALNFGLIDEDDPFNFGHPMMEERPLSSALVSLPLPPPVPAPVVKPVPPPVPMIVSSPPPVSVSVPATSSTPSSLSRPTSRTSLSMIPRVVSPPVSPGPATRPSNTKSSRSPTPDKWTPSSIPQPLTRSAPTPPLKPKIAPTSTFIRQPSVRKSSIKAETVTSRSSPNVPLDERINVTSLNRSPTSEYRAFSSFFNSFSHNNQSAPISKMNVDFVPDDQHTRLQDYTTPPDDSQSLTHTVMSPSSSTTRLSFQTLTNLVPWSSRNRPTTAARSPPSSNKPVSPSRAALPKLVSTSERGFVSREKQLHKLQSRMQMEDVVGSKSSVHVQCEKCTGEVAFI